MSFWAIIHEYRRASGPIFPIFPYIVGLTRGVGRGGGVILKRVIFALISALTLYIGNVYTFPI